MAEQKVYIYDTHSGMSPHDRNMQLSAELATAPNVNRKILCIGRDADHACWVITYDE